MLLGEVSIPRALYQMVGKRPVIWVTEGDGGRGGIQLLSTWNGATKFPVVKIGGNINELIPSCLMH